jgi:hypothetical protein
MLLHRQGVSSIEDRSLSSVDSKSSRSHLESRLEAIVGGLEDLLRYAPHVIEAILKGHIDFLVLINEMSFRLEF